MQISTAIHRLNETRLTLHTHDNHDLLSPGQGSFENRVQATIGHNRSPEVRQLERQIATLHDDPSVSRARHVLQSISQWRKQQPMEVSQAGISLTRLGTAVLTRVMAAEADRLLQALVSASDVAPARRAVTIQQAASQWEASLEPEFRGCISLKALRDAVRVRAALTPHMKALKTIGQYACTDFVTYRGMAPAHKRESAMVRLDEFNQDTARQIANHRANTLANMATMKAGQGTLTMQDIDAVARRVHEARAGCCTTMAYAALAELMKGPALSERVELVAYRAGRGTTDAHCYLIVGRIPNTDLADPARWGAATRILDPWAVVLGGPLLSTPQDPPIANMFPPTETIWEIAAEKKTLKVHVETAV